ETGRVNAVGLTWSVTYDALGRGLSKTDPDKGTTNFTYDAEGRLLSEVNAATAFFFTYDPCGRMLTKTDGVNALWQFAYDFNGNKTQVVEPLGNTTDSVYNALNQCISVIERGILNNPADDKVAFTTYNADGTKSATTNFAGQVINYYNDYRGRLWMQSYVDVLSPLNSVTETFAYDHCNRLTAHSYSSSVGQTTNSYVYGSRGWITSKTVTLVSPGAPTLVKTSSRGYDFDGKVISETTTEGDINTFEFNEIGWCTSSTIRDITVLDVTRSYLRTTYKFDTGGRKTEETRFSGCPASWMFSNHLLYTYGTSNLTATETVESWMGFWNTEDLVTYTYDSAGRVITRSAFIDVKSFGYDAAGQLIYDNGMWQSYDLDGNRLTRGLGIWTYAYDMFNHLVTMTYVPTSTTYAYTYDANGNEVFRGDRPAETKIYDPLNRLVRHISTQTSYANFIYDEKNDMVMEEQVTGNGAQQQVAFRKAFTYYISRKNCVQYSWDNNPNSTWVFQIKWKHSASCGIPPFTPPITPIHTGASDEIFSFCLPFSIDCYDLGFLTPSGQDTTLGWQPGMETPLFVDAKIVSIANGGVWTGYTATTGIIGGFYVQDNSACIAYVFDSNTNDLLTAFDYSGDGSNTQVVGNQPIEHKFASGYEYPNGDMVYFRSRWYNISAGRFCSEDPLGDIDHTNLYLYCANDPVGNMDPYGEYGILNPDIPPDQDWFWSRTEKIDVMKARYTNPDDIEATQAVMDQAYEHYAEQTVNEQLAQSFDPIEEGKAAFRESTLRGCWFIAVMAMSMAMDPSSYIMPLKAGRGAAILTKAAKGIGATKVVTKIATTVQRVRVNSALRAVSKTCATATAKMAGQECKYEWHHLFSKEFVEQWEKIFAGIDFSIDDFMMHMPKYLHNCKGFGVHNGTENWNKVWREFLRANPKASPLEVIKQLNKMLKQFSQYPK
ncbi:MAG: RHS repeat-associated core domain-containing protein, partial [Candidatus Brocadiia bacterium]